MKKCADLKSSNQSSVKTFSNPSDCAASIMRLVVEIDRVSEKPLKKSPTQVKLTTDEKLLKAAMDGFASLNNAVELVDFNTAIDDAKHIISVITRRAVTDRAENMIIDALVEHVTQGDRELAEKWFEWIPFHSFSRENQEQFASLTSRHLYLVAGTIPNFDSAKAIAQECVLSLREEMNETISEITQQRDPYIIQGIERFYEALIQAYEKSYYS